MRFLHVHLLPALVHPESLRGGTVVVVDVLRASTTICHALAAGAAGVVPTGEVDEARRVAASIGTGVVLGGERGGERIVGFDFGNSPTGYTAESVGGRTVVFTTTNGTRALLHSVAADRIVVGCFANEAAVAADVARREGPVHVLCAGTNGAVTLEDVLFAGSLTARLAAWKTPGFEVANDSARLARHLYEDATPDGLLAVLRSSQGGRNLLQLGFDADVVTAAARDTTDIVPVFDPESGRIVRA